MSNPSYYSRNRERILAAYRERAATTKVKKCAKCLIIFQTNHLGRKFCDNCADRTAAARERDHHSRTYCSRKGQVGSVKQCKNCGVVFPHPKHGNTKWCDYCRPVIDKLTYYANRRAKSLASLRERYTRRQSSKPDLLSQCKCGALFIIGKGRQNPTVFCSSKCERRWNAGEQHRTEIRAVANTLIAMRIAERPKGLPWRERRAWNEAIYVAFNNLQKEET